VASAALVALRSITGASFIAIPIAGAGRSSPRRNGTPRSFPALTATLGGPNALDKMAAVQELAAHPLYRTETALILERSLRGESPALLAAGCAALRQTGARSAVRVPRGVRRRPFPRGLGRGEAALDAIRSRSPGSGKRSPPGRPLKRRRGPNR
jgi:hypothetical protein